MRSCNRFRRDGSACSNQTDNSDGWCHHPDCSGFPRSNPSRAPEPKEAPDGTPEHIRETSVAPLSDIAVEDIPNIEDIGSIYVTTRALDSFRFHHGGGEREARRLFLELIRDRTPALTCSQVRSRCTVE
jgi:hypothetical protein